MNNDPQTYAIIGAAMEAHRELGHGFLEAVYQEALAIELATRKIHCQREMSPQIKYKSQPLTCADKADFICYENILVEVKAIQELGNPEKAQVINNLHATKFTRALLLNFGSASLEYQRMVLNHPGDKTCSDKNLRQSAPFAGL